MKKLQDDGWLRVKCLRDRCDEAGCGQDGLGYSEDGP